MANKDYALFQKAVASGLMNRVNDKIRILDQLLEDIQIHPYMTDALFEMGNAHMTINPRKGQFLTIKRVTEEFPTSNFVSAALLQLGLIDYNRSRNQDAISFITKRWQKVIPGTPESRSALAGLRNIYLDMNDVDSYVAYTRTLGDFASVTISEQDSLTYIAAENLYMAGKCGRLRRASQGTSSSSETEVSY
jgi:hypothetical protein